MRKTNNTKTAAIAAALIALCLCILPDATKYNFDYPDPARPAVERIDFARPVPVFATLLAARPDSKAAVAGAQTIKSTLASVTYPIVPVRHASNAYQIGSHMPSEPAKSVSLLRPPESDSKRIGFDNPTLAPMAFVRFCKRYPQDCKVHRMAFRGKLMELTNARRAELLEVNREVNLSIRPQENLNGVMAEEWLLSPRAGDCNDYAVTKRHILLARGWPSRSLLLAEVVVPSGEHHLVLVARSGKEDLVLDNLNTNVRSASEVGYQWIRAQQTKNPRFWSKVSVIRATRIAMNAR